MAETNGIVDTTSTSGSWWDANSGTVINSISDTVGDLLQFGVQYAALQNGQPAPAQSGGVVYVPAPASPQPPQQTSTWVYVVIIVLVLLLVLGGVYFFTRKAK